MRKIDFLCILMLFLYGCGNTPPDAADFPQITDAELAASPSAEWTLSASTETAEPTLFPTAGGTPAVQASSEPSTPPPEPDPGVTMAFVGDIMLGRSLGARIDRGEGETIFASVEIVLQAADITIGNLECALGSGGTKAPKAYTFLAPPEAARLLRDAGFDLLSLANNHSLDYGLEVFDQTGKILAENGIRFIGAGADEITARAPARLEAGGFRIALLAYADVPVEYLSKFDARDWTAGPSTPGISWAEDEKIKQDLKALEGDTDITIVLFHFGTEGLAAPDKRQIQLSRLAIDYGADVIVGSHPHMVQGVEQYKDGYIFYSLGNFIFDGFAGEANRSAILWITVSAEKELTYALMSLNIVDGIPRIGE
ncbi:MAG: CapA family protein [Anaerolineales bacterium]|nr:CapA family protein [Anaerolineales bacterium]